MLGFRILYVVTFDNRTNFIVKAKDKKEAIELAMIKKEYQRENAHWYTANEITGVHTFFREYFFLQDKNNWITG